MKTSTSLIPLFPHPLPVNSQGSCWGLAEIPQEALNPQ